MLRERGRGADGLRAHDLARGSRSASPTSSGKLPNVDGASVERLPVPADRRGQRRLPRGDRRADAEGDGYVVSATTSSSGRAAGVRVHRDRARSAPATSSRSSSSGSPRSCCGERERAGVSAPRRCSPWSPPGSSPPSRSRRPTRPTRRSKLDEGRPGVRAQASLLRSSDLGPAWTRRRRRSRRR